MSSTKVEEGVSRMLSELRDLYGESVELKSARIVSTHLGAGGPRRGTRVPLAGKVRKFPSVSPTKETHEGAVSA